MARPKAPYSHFPGIRVVSHTRFKGEGLEAPLGG